MDLKDILIEVRDTLRANLVDPYVTAGGDSRIWIHTDNPLNSARYPRIKISKVQSNNDIISIGTNYTDIEKVIISVVFFTKDNFSISVNSTDIKNELLVEYYLSEIKRVLKENQSTLQLLGIDGFKCMSTSEPVFDHDTQLHYGEIFCRFWFFNIG